MSAWSDIRDSVRKIILMQDKIDRLASGLSRFVLVQREDDSEVGR